MDGRRLKLMTNKKLIKKIKLRGINRINLKSLKSKVDNSIPVLKNFKHFYTVIYFAF